MIIEFFMSAIRVVIKTIIGVLPDIPQMPSWVDTAGDYLLTSISGVTGILAYLYTPQLFIFGLTVMIVLINFETFYHLTMWVVRKLPWSIH